jgi:hypothetical protein
MLDFVLKVVTSLKKHCLSYWRKELLTIRDDIISRFGFDLFYDILNLMSGNIQIYYEQFVMSMVEVVFLIVASEGLPCCHFVQIKSDF